MRYFALAIAVVLVGGYVFGQQPAAEPKPEAKESEEEFFTVESAFERLPLSPTDPLQAAASAVAKALAESKTPAVNPVGRYVPFGNDRMLDTTNGTLFRIEGKSWVPAVELQYLSYEILDEEK